MLFLSNEWWCTKQKTKHCYSSNTLWFTFHFHKAHHYRCSSNIFCVFFCAPPKQQNSIKKNHLIQNIAAKNKSFFFVRSNYFVVKGKFFFTCLLALPVVVCTRANEHNIKKKIKTIYVYKIVYISICIVRKWVRDIYIQKHLRLFSDFKRK